MGITLMTDIKNDAVLTGIVDTMQRNSQFDCSKIRCQMASCPGNVLYDHLPQFGTQLGELFFRNLLNVCGTVNCF
jgi:hypothetical protein